MALTSSARVENNMRLNGSTMSRPIPVQRSVMKKTSEYTPGMVWTVFSKA